MLRDFQLFPWGRQPSHRAHTKPILIILLSADVVKRLWFERRVFRLPTIHSLASWRHIFGVSLDNIAHAALTKCLHFFTKHMSFAPDFASSSCCIYDNRKTSLQTLLGTIFDKLLGETRTNSWFRLLHVAMEKIKVVVLNSPDKPLKRFKLFLSFILVTF